MTKEEAIKILKSKVDGSVDTSYEWAEAVRMAIEALKEKGITHCKDCEYYRTPDKYSYKEPNPYCCRSALTKVSENDFCSKAIRKDGERI